VPGRYLPEFTYAGATYDVDASLARGWVDELAAANALTECARAAAQEMARLSPKAFAQAKKQLRQEVSERVERGGAMTDQTVTDIWTEAIGYISDYVARTLTNPDPAQLVLLDGSSQRSNQPAHLFRQF
jgi:enoyl-CoA hydratase/carnithine racemase